MKKFLLVLLVFLAACQSESTPETGAAEVAEAPGTESQVAETSEVVADVSASSVIVNMGGTTHRLGDLNAAVSYVKLGNGELAVYLEEDGQPLNVTFNLKDPGLIGQSSAAYELPGALQGEVMMDLNFEDRERPGLAMQQRIVFSAGTIEIQQVAQNRLQMSFKGEGHPLMSQEAFPIEGSIDVRF